MFKKVKKLDLEQNAAVDTSIENEETSSEEKNTPIKANIVNLLSVSEEIEQDKIAHNLVTSVEQILRTKRLTEHNLMEFQRRNQQAREQIDNLQAEISNLLKELKTKDKQIKDFQATITNNNMNIDQLMENYSNLQTKMADEVRGLRGAFETEQTKYKRMQEAYDHERKEYDAKLKENEETILELKSQNDNMKALYESIRKENTYLVGMVNDFTNRMSTSFTKYSNQEKEYEEVE